MITRDETMFGPLQEYRAFHALIGRDLHRAAKSPNRRSIVARLV